MTLFHERTSKKATESNMKYFIIHNLKLLKSLISCTLLPMQSNISFKREASPLNSPPNEHQDNLRTIFSQPNLTRKSTSKHVGEHTLLKYLQDTDRRFFAVAEKQTLKQGVEMDELTSYCSILMPVLKNIPCT